MYQAVRGLSDQAYPRSARWPIGFAPDGAYLWAMTTYTTPHFATGVPDGNVRPNPAPTRARPAPAATYRTAGVTNEAALMAEGQTPDWQPGASKGVPKAAIGALGAALVGGVALAIVLMAPSNKVTKPVMPDPIAQAAATDAAAAKSTDGTDAAVNQMDKQAPAAGAVLTTSQAASAATDAAAVPAPVEAVVPVASPVANAPVAHAPKAKAAPVAAPRVVKPALGGAPDVPARTVTPPADIQPPAMQQTPETPTVTPSTPAPAPTPDTPAPTPAPAQ